MKTFVYVDHRVKENTSNVIQLIQRDAGLGFEIMLSTCTTAEKVLAQHLDDRGIPATSITQDEDITRIFGSPDKVPCLEVGSCPEAIKKAYMNRIKQGIMDADNVILIGAGDLYIHGLVEFTRENDKSAIIINYMNTANHPDAIIFTDDQLKENTIPPSL